MLAVNMRDVQKSYGITDVLKGFSLSVNKGEKIALIGANGCGKTTVLKIIAGKEEYSGGHVAVKNNIDIGYLKQIPQLNPENTLYDELLEVFDDLFKLRDKITELERKISENSKEKKEREKLLEEYSELRQEFELKGGYKYKSDIYKIAIGLGFKHEELNKKASVLSGGEKTRLGLVKLLLTKPDLLLLDEPTNHLDIPSRQWLEEYLYQYPGAVIIISHDRYFLDRVTNKIVELKMGKDEVYHGNYTYYLQERKKRFEQKLHTYKNQQKKIKEKEEAIKRLQNWSKRGDNPQLARKAKSMEKSLERMEKIEKPELQGKKMGLELDFNKRSGEEVLKLKNIEKKFNDEEVLSELNLALYFGEKSAIIGRNGSGKTTILRIISERMAPDRGDVFIGTGVKIGYYEQEFSGFNAEHDLITALRKEAAMTEGEARNKLASFLFTEDEVFKKVKDLSGGEKSRLRLLQLMNGDYNFLILDEPTNHLDLPSREVLEDVLQEYKGTILMVSHDRYFLNKIVNYTYELDRGQVKKYYGNYDYYLQKKKQQRDVIKKEVSDEKDENNSISHYSRWKEKKKKERKKEKKINSLEERIMDLEEEQKKIEQEMVAPENLSNYTLLHKLEKDYRDVKNELEEIYKLWENHIDSGEPG